MPRTDIAALSEEIMTYAFQNNDILGRLGDASEILRDVYIHWRQFLRKYQDLIAVFKTEMRFVDSNRLQLVVAHLSGHEAMIEPEIHKWDERVQYQLELIHNVSAECFCGMWEDGWRSDLAQALS